MSGAGKSAPRSSRRWLISLAVAGLLAVTVPVWGQTALILALSTFEIFGQITSVHAHPPAGGA